MYAPRTVQEISVPRDAVGLIIGKAGKNIRQLTQESGASIQFSPDDNPSATDRLAKVEGSVEQIKRAIQMISDLVSGTPRIDASTEIGYISVPQDATGMIIGRGGCTIKQICAETGAFVELSREPQPNPNEKIFVIKGTSEQIESVKAAIYRKLAEPFTGPSSSQYSGSVPSGYYSGQAAWNVGGQNLGYYQPMQQIHFPSQTQQGALQQSTIQQSNVTANSSTSGAPAINPITGQPDYSAQWAEYYRTMGMHEQAEQVEMQMKQQRELLQQQQQAAGVSQAQIYQV